MVSQQVKDALRVTVVLPTYNQAQYLPQALDSALHQTWWDVELIVVNCSGYHVLWSRCTEPI